MGNDFRLLEWDSSFFGYKIAALHPSGLSSDELKRMVDDLFKGDFKLAYCFINPEDEASIKSLLNASAILADEKITYFNNDLREDSNFSTTNIKPFSLTLPTEKLRDLALQSGLFSRFKIDGNFHNQEYEKLYSEWILKSVNKTLADETLVYYDENDENGFITLSVKGNIGSIGLIAVDEKVRGKAIGKKLINAAIGYFLEKDVTEVEVVTQKANKPACFFYESMGFKIKNITNIYHLWIR